MGIIVVVVIGLIAGLILSVASIVSVSYTHLGGQRPDVGDRY